LLFLGIDKASCGTKGVLVSLELFEPGELFGQVREASHYMCA